MTEKFKKASNDRLISWIQKAIEVLQARGCAVRFQCKL